MLLITPLVRQVFQAALLLGCAGGVVSLAGCEKRLDPQEYGQVLDSLPQVEGADKPWPLPEMQGEDKLPKGAERFLK